MNITRRRGSAAIAAAALMLTLAGCGSDSPKRTNEPIAGPSGKSAATTTAPLPDPTAAPLPTATAPPEVPNTDNQTGSQDRQKTLDKVFGEQAPFTGPAADKFGADNVMTAYKYLVTFTLDYGFTETLMRPKDKYQPIEFSFIKPFMAAKAQADWDASVNAALAGDAAQITNVNVMTLWNVNVPGYTLTKTRPVRNQKWSPANTLVDGNRLVVRFKVSADIVFDKGGKEYVSTVTKDMTFWVIPNGDPEVPWLIDGWQGSYNSSGFKPL